MKSSSWKTRAALLAVAIGTAVYAAASFTPENQPVGWIAQPELSNFDLVSNSETVFVTSFEKSFWSGDVRAYPISSAGAVDLAGNRWSIGGAASAIASQDWNTGRRIVTIANGVKAGFRWAALSATQQTAIGSAQILEYVRGSRANESPNGLNLRPRRYVLGDIQRSRPLYVPGTTPMLYVGANDGMLHALNASTGEEVYAYIPSMLIGKLKQLAPVVPTAYTHTHFVDASPAAGKVGSGASAKTVLAGGLGAGGRGLYALDITSDAASPPGDEAAAATRILWELTNISTGYANLGHTYGEVQIAPLNNGATGLVSPNGYMSTTGKASLFLIDPLAGTLIRELDTGSGSAASPSGLSSATLVDADGNGTADYAYAGDLDGNIWKFDLSSSSASSWSVTKLFTTSPAQAITGAPAVTRHPSGGRMVIFGTGRVLVAADLTDNAVHYVYGIRDGAPAELTALQTQTLTEKTAAGAGGAVVRVRTATVNAMDWAVHMGWKVALPAGERLAGDRSPLASGRFVFHSYNPTLNASAVPAGENWSLQLDYLSGGGAVSPFIDLNADGLLNDLDRALTGAGPVAGADGVPVGNYLKGGVMSQPVLAKSGNFLRDLYSENPNIDPVTITAAPDERGVSGGHFDPDIYYASSCTGTTPVCTGWDGRKHFHEYDDTFDVTGVNMLNASSPDLNLSKATAVFGAATEFKVLVMNQYLNPAATVKVGPSADFVSVKTYNSLASETDATTLLAALPSYTAANIGNLQMNLPLDAFASKNWWGNGDVRAGLIPTATGCVNKMATSGTTPVDSQLDPTPGIQGERHNGALVVQLIRATTPSSALQLNVAGKPEYGWRVKNSEFFKHVLAEWTYFWHHPNGQCYKSGTSWVKNPPEDHAGGSKGSTPAVGSADPKFGSFGSGGTTGTVGGSGTGSDLTVPSGVTETSRTVSATGNTVTLVITYSDGKTIKIETTKNGNGTASQKITNRDGVVSTSVRLDADGRMYENVLSRMNAVRSGRVSWKEVIRD